MKDFIGEFKEYQSTHPVQVKYEPRAMMKPVKDPTKIEEKELKTLVTEAVVNFMNTYEPEKCELLFEQKQEILEKVKLYENHPGFMGMSSWDNKDKNECSIGARIDPTNTKNWCRTREEIFYRLPYSYKDSLQEFLKEIRNK